MKANDVKLGKFLDEEGAQFIIPIYQRNYSWKHKNIKQLLEDIEKILTNNKYEHYLGSVVYYDDTNSREIKKYLIIDGQQRITSMFIFLYAIINYYKENKISEEYLKLNKYLKNNWQDKDENKLRLKPKISDDTEFEKIIDGRSDLNNQSSVTQAYYQFKEQINKWYKWCKEKKENFINKILDCFDNKINIVCVYLKNDGQSDNAQQIFESINSTGRPLDPSDLIRNYLLMGLNEKQQKDLFTNYWWKIEDMFKDNKDFSLDEVFRIFLAYENKNYCSKEKLYDEFKNWYLNKNQDKEKAPYEMAEEFLDTFLSFCNHLKLIYFENESKIDKDIRKNISEFRKYFQIVPAPLLIKCYELYLNNSIDYMTFNNIIFLIHSFFIRRAICDIDTKGITNIFPQILGKVLDKCKNNFSNIFDIIKFYLVNKFINSESRMPIDKEIISQLKVINSYSHVPLLKLVLLKIETQNNENILDPKKLSIDHIAPQKPNEEWLKNFESKNEYESLVDTIGNLTLVSSQDNSSMGNHSFEYKQKILKQQNHIKLNIKILETHKWNGEEILKRSEFLAHEIIKLYPYQLSNLKLEDEEQKQEIYGKWGNKKATAYLFRNGDVEIQPGSQISDLYKNGSPYQKFKDKFKELYANNIIVLDGDEYIFQDKYLFSPKRKNSTALSYSANFLICCDTSGKISGREFWKDLNGKKLSYSDDDELNTINNAKIHEKYEYNESSNNILKLWAEFVDLAIRINEFSELFVKENFRDINVKRIDDVVKKLQLSERDKTFLHSLRIHRNKIAHNEDDNKNVPLHRDEFELDRCIIKKMKEYIAKNK